MYTAFWQLLVCSTVLAACSGLNWLISTAAEFSPAPSRGHLQQQPRQQQQQQQNKLPQLQMPRRAAAV
jgi:hypothetical protein